MRDIAVYDTAISLSAPVHVANSSNDVDQGRRDAMCISLNFWSKISDSLALFETLMITQATRATTCSHVLACGADCSGRYPSRRLRRQPKGIAMLLQQGVSDAALIKAAGARTGPLFPANTWPASKRPASSPSGCNSAQCRVGWVEEEVLDWVKAKIAERDRPTDPS